jgi:integrase
MSAPATKEMPDWLERLGMSEYAQRFAENRIDVSVLPELTDLDLEEIGVVRWADALAEAEIAKRPALTRTRMFRDGLMIALLAYCPIRLKNFAALEIGRSFVNVYGKWWIVLTAAETKEKREDERPVTDELTGAIEHYLQMDRPILAGGKAEANALWLAINGKPMSYASMGELIAQTTRMTIGVAVSAHLFRTAAVTTLAIPERATTLTLRARSCITDPAVM